MHHTVLIVDDYESVRSTLAYLLNQDGYRALVADSGRAAIDVAATEPVEVALVDLLMPGMDGIQTCVRLLERSRAGGARLKVILMTGAFTTEAQQRAFAVGAVAVVKKPFDFGELRGEIDRALATEAVSPAVATSIEREGVRDDATT